MKFKFFLAVAGLTAFAACKTPSTYRAADATVTVTTPSLFETTFQTQYPNASNVVWGYYDPAVMTPMDWELTGWTTLDANARLVHFNQDNQNYYVLYDRSGYRVATAYVLTDYSVIPAAISDRLQVLYPAYTVTGLSRVTLNSKDNRMAYEVDLKKMYYTAHVLIDDQGNVIDTRLVAHETLQ